MEIEVKLDSAYPEPKVVILTAAMNETVSEIVRKLSEEQSQIISGTRDGLVEVLEPQEIIRIYADSGKTIAATTKDEYTLRLRLYEAEERLDGRHDCARQGAACGRLGWSPASRRSALAISALAIGPLMWA